MYSAILKPDLVSLHVTKEMGNRCSETCGNLYANTVFKTKTVFRQFCRMLIFRHLDAFRSVFSPVFTHSPNMCPVFGKSSPCWSIYNILFLSNCVIIYVLIEKKWCMTDLGCTHSLYETCGHYYQSSSGVIWRTSAFSLCFRSFRKPPFHWDHFW